MNKKQLQFLGSLAQILSSLAVLVSIGLLITEYRRSGVLNEKNVENLVYGRVEKRTWEDWNRWFMQEVRGKPALSLEGNLKQLSSDFLEFMGNDLH